MPGAVALNPVNNKVYVPNDSGADVTVIDEVPFFDAQVRAVTDSLP
jgi:DNA-binding beta-propeller fold protein YncE